ncbi:MAG: DUF5686 and carboxypeptidase regulatory-like domain-containing protein, partial [Saprospiraceae bacterium]
MTSFVSQISLCILFIVGSFNNLTGQLKGKISDADGQPLAYATIYLESTSYGTITNAEGEYSLDMPAKGTYKVIYQYVGYKTASRSIDYDKQPIIIDIILKNDENIISELVITADREDPAYAIIRKAIGKRSYYKNLIKSYESDLYVKGVVKLLDAPDKILGEEVGDLNGILDSTRQGIVYLSESKSKFYFLAPDRTKEVMISTIKSGNDNLFTANQFSWASFDLYSEYLNFSRSIVSPIADNALNHYRYKLENVRIDENGFSINKIKIIPKTETSPLLHGYIYIVDDLWNISSTDIKLFGTALKNTFLDTIEIKQVYVNIGAKDTWRLFNQGFKFQSGLLGFKIGGHFSYIFSNYELGKDVSDQFKNKETFRVDENALKKDTNFWSSTRPIPLTEEEQKDYIQKDSLRQIWDSRAFKDSMDRKNNEFTWIKILTGYSRQNTFKNTELSFPSPLSTVRFNAVEGFKLSFNAIWEQSDSMYRKWTVHPVIEYGFSDKILKPWISVSYRFDNYNQGVISLNAGRQNQQFEPREPITERNNSWNSLWNKRNNIRLFQNEFIVLSATKEISNGIYLGISTSYTYRKPVSVNTQYSIRKKDEQYAENIARTDLPMDVYAANKYWQNKVTLRIRPFQKYSSYPYVKIRNNSEGPRIMLEYEDGIAIDKASNDYHKLTLSVRDNRVNAKLLGYFSYNVEGGTTLRSSPTYFGDYFHPMGNELLSPIDPDLSSFNLLP